MDLQELQDKSNVIGFRLAIHHVFLAILATHDINMVWSFIKDLKELGVEKLGLDIMDIYYEALEDRLNGRYKQLMNHTEKFDTVLCMTQLIESLEDLKVLEEA